VLEEIDLSSSKIVKTSPSNPTPTLQEEESRCRNHEGIKWVGRLPEILHELDFSNVQVERVDQLGWKLKMWQQQQLLVKEEYTNNYVRVRSSSEKLEVERRKIRDMWSEVQQGSALGVCLQTVVAQCQ